MAHPRISRRRLIKAGGGVAAVAGVTALAPLSNAAETPAGARSVTLREGTNMCAALSPDKATVVIDLVGVLWTLPLAGGRATPITDASAECTQPDWSPDGRTITFQSYEDGNFHVFTVNRDGTGRRRLTSGPYDHREPRFSPDGRTIAFSSDRGGNSYGIHVLDLATGAITPWADTPLVEETAPAWSADGTTLAFLVGTTAIEAADRAGTRRRLVDLPGTQLGAPSWLPDDSGVAHTVHPATLPGPYAVGAHRLMVGAQSVSDTEDLFPFRPMWLSPTELLYTANGRIRRRSLTTGAVTDSAFTAEVAVARRAELPRRELATSGEVRGVVSPALSPDGTHVAFGALGDLWLMRIGASPQKLTTDDFFACDPAWSRDGTQLAYTSDRAGNPDLWIRTAATGEERRLTALPHAAVAAAWSPTGDRIAFQDQDGATYVVTVATGAVQRVLTKLFQPGRPSWSADGNVLAFAAQKPYSAKFREGTNQILTLDLRTGAVTYAEAAPHRSLSTRGYDGPVWSPDGTRLAYVLGSQLWTHPVDAAGRLTGPPRKVSDEIADAPSWSGDSTTLLYVSNGRLRLVAAGGGSPRSVPLSFTWRAPAAPPRAVIHAGRLWDGRSSTLRTDMDITVENGRITSVAPHVAGRSTVDASDLTVLPGLVDAHVHAHMKGRFYGARQGRLWLAFGITSIRSPGDPVYQAIEEREAVAAGGRLGPRYFATGEAIDGSRVYYNFMRPTTGVEEVQREVARALALDYDLVKTYVRLPAPAQRAVIEAAHRRGRWVTSHYLYPSARFGIDGMEHLVATSRLGYSHNLSRKGRGYADVVALFGASAMAITPTLFAAAVLLLRDSSLPSDRRVTALYPPWELAALNNTIALLRAQPPETVRLLEELLATNVDTVRRIQGAGGLVVTGTDAPIDHPAVSLHLNLRALVAGGMTPVEALRTATGNAARVVGLPHRLGTVEPDRIADLSFVSGDPLTDIAAAANVRMVMTGGALHTVDALLAPYAGVTARGAHAPEAPLASPASNDRYWWHRHTPHGSCC